jgi:spore coat protein U-like protein
MKTLKLNSRALSMAVASILAVGVGAFSVNSYAEIGTANLGVSASITNTCTIAVSQDVSFGAYDPIVANNTDALPGAGTVTTFCTIGSAPTIKLGLGVNGTGTGTGIARFMTDGAGTPHLLAYNLYKEAGRTTVWGETKATGLVAAQSDGVLPVVTDIYGKIGAGQVKPAGTYTDTVVVTFEF